MKHSENFELFNTECTLGFQQIPCSAELAVRLTLMTGVNIPQDLQKPSGIFESHATKNFAGNLVKDIYGKYELVVGDGQCVELIFTKPAKNLRFQYYQVPDYTVPDEAYKNKKIKDMTLDDLGFEFKAFNKRDEKAHKAVPNGFLEIRWGEYTDTPFTHVVFMSNLIGSLHIDQITWET